MSGPRRLTAEEQSEAYRRVGQWRADPTTDVGCPACQATGLAIFDRSARPYAEWYQLVCKCCGLDKTIGVPLGAPPPSLD